MRCGGYALAATRPLAFAYVWLCSGMRCATVTHFREARPFNLGNDTTGLTRYQKVMLMLSVLKYMGQTWPMARNALSQLQAVANATFPRDPRSANERPGRPAESSNIAGSGSLCETGGRQDFAINDIPYTEPIWEDMDWFGLFTSVNENENELSSFMT